MGWGVVELSVLTKIINYMKQQARFALPDFSENWYWDSCNGYPNTTPAATEGNYHTLFTIKNGSILFSKYMVNPFNPPNYEFTSISRETSIFKQQIESYSVSKLGLCI